MTFSQWIWIYPDADRRLPIIIYNLVPALVYQCLLLLHEKTPKVQRAVIQTPLSLHADIVLRALIIMFPVFINLGNYAFIHLHTDA